MTFHLTEWRPFPDPRRGDLLVAPFGPGCYQVRHISTGQKVLFGMGGHVASRLSSLLPEPLGTGRRNNADKRTHSLDHIEDLEYRTLPCRSRVDAEAAERELKGMPGDYIYGT